MKELILKVNGMHCGGCENRIQNVILQMENIENVVANHTQGIVVVNSKEEIDLDEIKEKIEDLGFEVEDN